MILERQREGVAIAKAVGEYKDGKASLTSEQVTELRARSQPDSGRISGIELLHHLSEAFVEGVRRP